MTHDMRSHGRIKRSWRQVKSTRQPSTSQLLGATSYEARPKLLQSSAGAPKTSKEQARSSWMQICFQPRLPPRYRFPQGSRFSACARVVEASSLAPWDRRKILQIPIHFAFNYLKTAGGDTAVASPAVVAVLAVVVHCQCQCQCGGTLSAFWVETGTEAEVTHPARGCRAPTWKGQRRPQ